MPSFDSVVPAARNEGGLPSESGSIGNRPVEVKVHCEIEGVGGHGLGGFGFNREQVDADLINRERVP